MQSCASAFCCAAGSTAAGLISLAEVGQQTPQPDAGVRLAAASLTAGVLAGLWIPRAIIRRRLAASGTQAATARPLVADSDFAASLSGSLVLVLAILWCAVLAWDASAETLRAALATRWLLPGGLKLVVLLTPAVVGLALAGVVGTMTLVSLHGWYRALTFPRMPIAGLWVVILLGDAAGAALTIRLDPRWGSWAAVLMLCMAAWITGLRPRAGVPARGVTGSIGPLPWRGLWPALSCVTIASAALGFVQQQAIGHSSGSASALGRAALLTAAGALAGPILARVRGLRHHPTAAGVVALLLAGAGWALLPGALAVRLVVCCGLISLVIVVSAQGAAERLASVQQALTTCGMLVAAGFLLGLASAPWHTARPARAPAGHLVAGLPPVVQRALALEAVQPVRTIVRPGQMAMSDLSPPAPRTVVLSADASASLDAQRLERLMRRLVRVLGPDGRMVLVGGDADIRRLTRWRNLWPLAWQAHRLIKDPRRHVELIGPDIPAWLTHVRGPHDAPLRLERR